MRILKIEQKFQSEDTLDQVLEELKDEFGQIDYWATILKSNEADNIEEVKRGLNELTGTFITLKTALAIAESEKKNREIRYYNNLRIEKENNEEKFVSAPAEKEASAAVASYRRVRNIIKGYTEAAQTGISTFQSILKAIIVEKQLAGNTQG